MARIFSELGIGAAGNLLPPEKIDIYKETLSTPMPEERRAFLIGRAEEALAKEIPMLTASLYREFSVNGNRSNFQTLYFRRRVMLMDLTLGEHLERKGRFTEKIADLIWAIMEESTWMIPASHPNNSPYGAEYSLPPVFGEDREHGIELFSPATGAVLAAAYYMLPDELDAISPVIREKMYYTLYKRLIKPYLHINFRWMGDTAWKANNWAPWISSNILTVAAIILKDPYELTRVVNRSIKNLDNFLNQYAPDGGCDEGPSYWQAAGGSLFDALEILYSISDGKIDIFDQPLIKNIGEYMVHVHINGKYFINFADCATAINPTARMLYRFGTRCASKALTDFACHASKEIPGADTVCQYDHMYRAVRDHYTVMPEGEEPEIELTSYMAGNQVLTLRSERARERGTFFAIKGGNNNESHNHNDIGSFILYKNGQPVIIDAGVGVYTKQTFSSDRYKLWNMRSAYHSLPSFGGVDQMVGAQYHATVLDVSEEEKRIAYDLTRAYPEEAGLIGYSRTARMEGEIVTVTDTVSLKEEKEIDFHLLTHKEPSVSGSTVLLAEGVKLSVGGDAEITVEPFEPTGFAGPILGSDTLYRIHITATAKDGEYSFIFA